MRYRFLVRLSSPMPCPDCRLSEKAIGSGYCLDCKAARQRIWRTAHPLTEQQRRRGVARSYLNVYIRRGLIARGACEIEGCTRLPTQGHHHHGYDHPLDVRWLCKPHHRVEHHQMRAASRGKQ